MAVQSPRPTLLKAESNSTPLWRPTKQRHTQSAPHHNTTLAETTSHLTHHTTTTKNKKRQQRIRPCSQLHRQYSSLSLHTQTTNRASLTRYIEDELRTLVLVEVDHVSDGSVRQRRTEHRNIILRKKKGTKKSGKKREKRRKKNTLVENPKIQKMRKQENKRSKKRGERQTRPSRPSLLYTQVSTVLPRTRGYPSLDIIEETHGTRRGGDSRAGVGGSECGGTAKAYATHEVSPSNTQNQDKTKHRLSLSLFQGD